MTDTDVVCRVIEGGLLSNNKGINLPGVAVSVPALSEKDKDDLRWALRMRVDMIALSFVRSADDLRDVHAIMDEVGLRLPVIAKIEKPQAVENLDEIIRAFDGVMVARGDLGVEMPLEEVPLVQKRACEIARRRAKPVIVATQVLESMIENSRPTRAEASDAANAVLDGADALMLSGETSVGNHPFEAVKTMARIIENTEDHGLYRIRPLDTRPSSTGGAVTAAAAEIGELLGARYLITFTQSGDSARRLSRVRPRIPMLAFTPLQGTRSQLALSWGVETFLVPSVHHTDEMAVQVDEVLLAGGRVDEGDLVLIAAGSPPGIPGTTNALRVHRVGDAKNRVAPAYESLADRGRGSTGPRFQRRRRYAVHRPPGWWNGRHGALKMLCPQGRAGSSPALGTTRQAGSARATRPSGDGEAGADRCREAGGGGGQGVGAGLVDLAAGEGGHAGRRRPWGWWCRSGWRRPGW